jgi:tripartite-type tricarboxylate transporter receptor subunit TctC
MSGKIMRIAAAFIGAAVSLALLNATASAQDRYPSHTVRIVVPTSPGAVTDVIARAIAQALSEAWGQPVVIDNRPGADEMLGDEIVAKADPDGYTLGIVSNGGITAAPQLHHEVHYDPQKDFTPIFMLGQVTPVMIVPGKSPVHTVQELIALAKSKPDELNYGSFGVGSYAHVAMEDFKRRTGVQLAHIPYRGATPAYNALIRDEVAVLIANLSGAIAQADAGNVRIIAAAGPHRSKARPDLPTVAESGVPGFSTGAWWGLLGPAKLPDAIVAKIRTDLTRVLDSPEMKKIYAFNTMERDDMTTAQFTQFIHDDTENWTRQIKAAGIQPD